MKRASHRDNRPGFAPLEKSRPTVTEALPPAGRSLTGFVTMSVVIVLLLVGISVTLFVLMLVWAADTGEVIVLDGTRARWYADACADHALAQLRFVPGYTGSESLSFENGSCVVMAIQASASDDFPVRAEGTSGRAFGRTLVTVELSVDASGDADGLFIASRSHVPDFE